MSTEPNIQVLALLAKEWDMRDSPRFIRKKRFNVLMTAQRNFCLGNSPFIVDEGFYRDVMLLDL